MPIDFWTYSFLCGSAFLAGIMNAVAGGGTLLTFPALTGVLSAAMANGTSTVALLPGSCAGALGYRKELWECRRFVLRMCAPSLAGGFLGAWLVGENQDAFATLVPWLILTAALLFVAQAPLSKWVKCRAARDGVQPEHHEPGRLTQALVIGFQFLVATYGGYFGAGIGILMLSALGFMGVGDIHRMNAVKTCLAALINAASVVVFVRDGLVDWNFVLVMAAAATAGGYIGARVARRLPASYVRYAVIAIGFGLSAFYFVKKYV
ncbi:sulfite exporter TauE/SafE family protein [Gemmata sp. JC717]|uniref:sulfite exporter TauE/SafE family protein n=1 Tax=Gemmata algarum TaxID=2975278 RepID=UPI0021BAC90A|nr:sulfite exporter TauE/SafE family protein [Gemmata algarum]MDY3551916.1 sulfite exporter TauE/SafE family protein [Gemmata algarum]